jgi:hypothetical protein
MPLYLLISDEASYGQIARAVVRAVDPEEARYMLNRAVALYRANPTKAFDGYRGDLAEPYTVIEILDTQTGVLLAEGQNG